MKFVIKTFSFCKHFGTVLREESVCDAVTFKASAHSLKRFTSPLFLKLSLSMHLLHRMNVMLDFIRTVTV